MLNEHWEDSRSHRTWGSSGPGAQIPIPRTSSVTSGITSAIAENKAFKPYLAEQFETIGTRTGAGNVPTRVHQPDSDFGRSAIHANEQTFCQSKLSKFKAAVERPPFLGQVVRTP